MAPHYSLIGRPSIDPELMVRMLLVGYLGGIRSERKLCAGMHLNLAHRWFCRLGIDDAVPDHSTFSKNRHRRFRDGDVFRAALEQVVHRCAEAGLVPGESAAVDGSQVDADASRHKRLPGSGVPEAWTTDRKAQARPVREHLDALDAAVPPGPDEPRHDAPKYLSPTDPGRNVSTILGSWPDGVDGPNGRWCTRQIQGEMAPSPKLLRDDRLATDGIRAPGRQHPVQHRHTDGSLSLLGREAAGSQTRSDQRLVTTHRRFH